MHTSESWLLLINNKKKKKNLYPIFPAKRQLIFCSDGQKNPQEPNFRQLPCGIAHSHLGGLAQTSVNGGEGPRRVL